MFKALTILALSLSLASCQKWFKPKDCQVYVNELKDAHAKDGRSPLENYQVGNSAMVFAFANAEMTSVHMEVFVNDLNTQSPLAIYKEVGKCVSAASGKEYTHWHGVIPVAITAPNPGQEANNAGSGTDFSRRQAR